MVPVRYEVMPMSELPIADMYNDTNFMFWQAGPWGHYKNAPPKGWHRHVKNRKKHYAVLPCATRNLVRGQSVMRFLLHRARLLRRSGGFYFVSMKISEPVPEEDWYAFSLYLGHYRHCGPTSPMGLMDPQEQLPEAVRHWFPTELPHG